MAPQRAPVPDKMRTVETPPRAALLIESMRDIGYTLETALADIVDNSIASGASTINIFVSLDPAALGVLDDGSGMDEEELLEAMRPGSRSPLEERTTSDLGRFGLGLKTASFSQCRKLTVVSRRNRQTSAAQWDLDRVARTDEWLVAIPDDPLSIRWAPHLEEQGTLVVWEDLDRVAPKDELGTGSEQFIQRIDQAAEHLELVFHRFLSGEPGQPKITILLNHRPLEPFDPFHSRHPATIRDPVETIRVGEHNVKVQAYTLPHHRNVSAAEWERYGGRAGYLRNQGFYVYRQRRLIIHGTWFGLARQIELTKLTRVQIDIPNALDSEWKVDVKKASAQPPHQVRDRLRRIIDVIGGTSKQVYKSRGKRLVEDHRIPLWHRLKSKDEIAYRINPDHPVLADFRSRLPNELHAVFMKIVETISASIPMDTLYADMGGNPEIVSNGTVTEPTLRHAVSVTYMRLLERDLPVDLIESMLQVAEPFRSNWPQTQLLLQQLIHGDGTLD